LIGGSGDNTITLELQNGGSIHSLYILFSRLGSFDRRTTLRV
jgi:hypothetical protein